MGLLSQAQGCGDKTSKPCRVARLHGSRSLGQSEKCSHPSRACLSTRTSTDCCRLCLWVSTYKCHECPCAHQCVSTRRVYRSTFTYMRVCVHKVCVNVCMRAQPVCLRVHVGQM